MMSPLCSGLCKPCCSELATTCLRPMPRKQPFELCRQHERIDVLLADASLQVMNGVDLAAVLRKSFPHLRLILMSGWEYGILSERVLLGGSEIFLRKPFQERDLNAAIRRALDHSQANPAAAGE